MFSATSIRFSHLVFYTSLALVLLFFFWSRINTSDYTYVTGDGTAIVALIQEMLASGDWTADLGRIAHRFTLQEEWQFYTGADLPKPEGHYFNLSGYTVVAAAVCAWVQALGGANLSIPFILHGFNVLLQALTLCLLFGMGKQIAGRYVGLLAMLFFTLLPLAVSEAHYERPEAWLALLSSLMLFAVWRYPQAPRSSACLMGGAFGLSVAVKFSQLFLGVIPFLLLCHVSSQTSSWTARIRSVLSPGSMMAIAMILAIIITVPVIFSHLPDYLEEVARTSGFFDTPHPMYAMEHYRYVSQLLYMGNYFESTLGIVWCVLLWFGVFLCVVSPPTELPIPWYFRLSLVIPPLFILFYFAFKYNFMERIFSATEPMLCLLSAMGVQVVYRTIIKVISRKIWQIVAILLLLLAALWKPVTLDYRFVQHHIRQAGYIPRITFQETLKKDFPGFWIKNVHMTLGFSGAIPEKPAKAPRIYHLEDYNQYWTASHLEKLHHNGFVLIATYCSDFADLPVSNQTLYHASAKNHYLVRQDEWPAVVAPGYFKTNCR